MPRLLEHLAIRGLTFSNRIFVSPMCEYSCEDGLANDWHLVHLGSRAVGGAGLVFNEATAVTPDGRISPQDLGLWSDRHAEPLARAVRFIHSQGRPAGIQLAHAGRKASMRRPWEPAGAVLPDEGGWVPVGPTSTAFAEGFATPAALDEKAITTLTAAFRTAAARALDAG